MKSALKVCTVLLADSSILQCVSVELWEGDGAWGQGGLAAGLRGSGVTHCLAVPLKPLSGDLGNPGLGIMFLCRFGDCRLVCHFEA